MVSSLYEYAPREVKLAIVGQGGAQKDQVQLMVRNLLRLRDIPVAFWDERWSSSVMNRFLIEEADLSRAKRAEAIDKNAAAYILQGALDRMLDASFGDAGL